MTRMIVAALFGLALGVPALHGQVYVPAQNGIGLQYSGGRLKVSGYYTPGLVVPVGPNGVVLGPPGYLLPPHGILSERRVIVQQMASPSMPRVLRLLRNPMFRVSTWTWNRRTNCIRQGRLRQRSPRRRDQQTPNSSSRRSRPKNCSSRPHPPRRQSRRAMTC